MSVQCGRWSFGGKPATRGYSEKVNSLLAPYGPDQSGAYSAPDIEILYHAFHTTKESRQEEQPHISPSGAVLTWDGRLDNRKELSRELDCGLAQQSTDVAIVAAAYERCGVGCFAKLIGDWALSIWNPTERSIVLAKDFAGTRPLYYTLERDQITWSSILDPLVLFAGKPLLLEEEYIAGWLSFFPAAHLTPYVGIHSVSPSTFVRLTPRRCTVQTYWDFDPGKQIRYRNDREYEEHFRTVFAQSVQRRLRSDAPILAELSGGMDSSSIVCMADKIIARGQAETTRLDTLSCFDDREPNWNERAFFTIVEQQRGRPGAHIDLSSQNFFEIEFDDEHPALTPAAGKHRGVHNQLAACLLAGNHCALLSGIGGDEVTGGVPTPVPELADLLTAPRFQTLLHQLKVWALERRKPCFQLLFEVSQRFFPPFLAGVPKHMRPAAWLKHDFVRRQRTALTGYPCRLRFFGPLPSFQESLSTLNGLRRQLGCTVPASNPACERRYPYLDRDLLEFLFAIPQEQLVRPGHRRSLMRRSLAAIVPPKILERKRKAFVARSPLLAVSSERQRILLLTQTYLDKPLQVVDLARLRESCNRIPMLIPPVQLGRLFSLVAWLEHSNHHLVPSPATEARDAHKYGAASSLGTSITTRKIKIFERECRMERR
ncbi:MAG: asparagine synthase-related protein [Candidatus Acidiferrales bacterium]